MKQHRPKYWLWLAVGLFLVGVFLRGWHLTTNPPALYWEEAALGYDAYSILKTGHDHHGHAWPVVAFESFGDWKPSLYFYAIVPFIYLFGLGSLAVRLPAMISGVVLMIGVAKLANSIYCSSRRHRIISHYPAWLVALGITAVSPWAIMFSRAGWEVNLATALITWGMVWGLDSYQPHQKQFNFKKLSLAIFSLSLSMYAYHAARVIAPLLGVGLMGIWYFQLAANQVWQSKTRRRQFWQHHRGRLIGLMILGGCLMAPLAVTVGSQSTQQRFTETSIFYDLEPVLTSNRLIEEDGSSSWSRLIHHRYLFFGQKILVNYLSYFTLDFLAVSGDQNLRHSTGYVGTLYHVELVFLLIGIYVVLKSRSKLDWLLVWWVVVGILPAAISKTNPHALRILPILPVVMVLLTDGVGWFYAQLGKTKATAILFWLIIIVIYGGEVTMFWRYYTQIYPQVAGSEWQQGYAQLVPKLIQASYDHPPH